MIKLTEEQLAVVKSILSALGHHDEVHIRGAAGTGKTTILEEIANQVNYDNVVLTAPTNKAAKIIAEKTGRHAITIHKLLKLVIKDEEDKQMLRIGGEAGFDPDETMLVIIDEASMLDKKLMAILHEIQERHGLTKVLYVGDPYQLNPIGEDITEAFNCSGIELKTIMRQAADNPIINLAYAFRDAQTGGKNTQVLTKPFADGEHIFHHRSFSQFMAKYLNEFSDGIETHMVAWRNDRVSMLNNYIRKKLYGEEASEPFLLGEEVMLYSPYQEFHNGKQITILDNSTFATVVDVNYAQKVVKDIPIDSIILTLDVDGQTYQLVTPKDQIEVDEFLRSIAAKAKQVENPAERSTIFKDYYYPVKNLFTTIKPAHAMTSHKSQGSTWESVFVDIADINANRNIQERYRSCYVAVTRSSERLHIYGR